MNLSLNSNFKVTGQRPMYIRTYDIHTYIYTYVVHKAYKGIYKLNVHVVCRSSSHCIRHRLIVITYARYIKAGR